jgi:hypothetical protein
MGDTNFQADPPRQQSPQPSAPAGDGEELVQKGPAPPRPAVRAEIVQPQVVYEGPDAVETFIPYRNPKGLLAYYLGLFSIVPCLGLVLGPAGLILGIMGLNYSRAHPEARGAGHAIAGIVLGILGSLINFGALFLFLLGAGIAAWSR